MSATKAFVRRGGLGPRGTIARRITLVFTGLVSLAVCVAALLTHVVYAHIEQGAMADLAQTEARRLVVRVSRFGGQWERPFERDMGPSMYAWGESGSVRAPSLPPELRALPIGLHALDRGASTWHVAVADAMDGRLYVVYDSTVTEQQASRLDHALVGIVLGCSILALLVSGAVARWLTTPLNTLIERLARWVPGSSVDEIPHVNEADRLMEAFNRAQDQIDASIADQRELSANLHHEVRTPLTVIRSDAEIMLMDGAPDGQRMRLARIVRSVQEIEQSLESTYRLAHARFDDETPVRLRQCVEDIFESLQLEARKSGLAFENAVAPAHEVLASRQALMTVMRNIIRNAVLHAAPATLVVESMPQGLRFTDSGPGISPTDLPHVFDRYFTRRQADLRQPGEQAATPVNQSGLGLAIAKRVCVIQSWQLQVDSPVRDGRGTRFTLTFEADD